MGELTLVLWTTDIGALSSFLERVAGATVHARHPGFASLSIGVTPIELHADEAYRGHPWFDALRRDGLARGIGAELRVAVDDVDASYQWAIAAGAASVQPPANTGETFECVVLGPDGYLVSLWQPVD